MVGSVWSNCCSAITDGMDQAKFKVPRTGERKSKLLDSLYRPMLHLAACWIHGFNLAFFVSDSDLKKDPNTQMELIARSLSTVYDHLGYLPMGFQSQQDNCFREAKNQYYTGFLLLLVVLDVFRWTLAQFLGVGHSHEDVDQVFGQCAGLIARNTFDEPGDVIAIVDEMCKPRTHATASRLDNVADWKETFVNRLGIRIKGLRDLAY
jgi:hypothetical protein